MKLKKLEITGFKSFSEKSVIHFPPGISAIVGPNGCGKSNIVDALRWVMGEQSLKQLRGKTKEDVIFAGTSGKPGMNLAEVSLTLVNDNGSAPEELRDFSEIMLTRRLYRSGETAYLLNKAPCRLKDIHNLFLGSGMGAKSYAVIQQGNIGAITDAGPDERRIFIEEAAGVTRYKNRKNEALAKVEATRQNLLRLADIISEVQRQMSGLQRQAKKAAQYNALKARIRSLDIRLALDRHGQLADQIAKTDALLVEMKTADLAHCARIKQLDAAVEGIKLERWQKNQEIADQKNRKFETQREIDRLENDLAHLRQEVARLGRETGELESARHDLAAKNETIDGEIDQVAHAAAEDGAEIQTVQAAVRQAQTDAEGTKQQLADLNREIETAKATLMNRVAEEARTKNICQNAASNRENLQRRLKRIDEEELAAVRSLAELEKAEGAIRDQLAAIRQEIAHIDRQIGATEDQLKGQSQALGTQVKAVLTLENEKSQLRSRYGALKKMEDNFEGYRDGVRAIMTRGGGAQTDGQPAPQVLGLVADILEPEAAFQAAVEAALGDALQHILVARQEDALALAADLREKGAGRSGFIPLSSIQARPPAARPTGDRLLDHVAARPGFEAVCAALLGHVEVVQSLPQAAALWHTDGRQRTLVTPAGEMVMPEGILIGGSRDGRAGILAKKREIRELGSRIAALDNRLDEARERQKTLENEVRDLETGLQKHLMAKKRAAQEDIEAEKAQYKAEEAAKQARRRLEIARLEQEQLIGEASDIEAQLEAYHCAVARIQAEVRDTQQAVALKSQEIGAVSAEMEAHSQHLLDLKLRQTALQARFENNTATLKRLRTFRDDGLKRLAQLAQEISQKTRKRVAAEEKIDQHQKRMTELYTAFQQLETSLENNEVSYRAIDASLKENDQAIAAIQTAREAALQKLRLLEVDRSQQALKQEALENRIIETYQHPLDDFRRAPAAHHQAPEESAPIDRPAAEMETELADCRKRLESFADVNLGAISEFEALEKRHAFLTGQQEDLDQALDDLQKVIRKINRITQERFITTFTLINEKLGEVFPRLFDGGTAQLVLTEPEKPLETGVELMIHPPGKKLTQLSLLSGGEKALSAIAFIFAIFLIKPASFCLLDEIDAPLDEANVYRFNNLLKIIGDKSQIIMITHNKKSMEFADTLFGVTMEKKGVSKLVSVNLTHPSEAHAALN
jgi:chromosome segregation protein